MDTIGAGIYFQRPERFLKKVCPGRSGALLDGQVRYGFYAKRTGP